MNSKELYNEFKSTNKENAKQYDLINSENADMFLVKKNNGKVDIEWPENSGYIVESIEPLENLHEDKLLCSRIEFDAMEISVELYMNKKIEDFNKEDKEWYKLIKDAMHGEDTKTFFNITRKLRKNIHDPLHSDECKISAKSLGNCFGYQTIEETNDNEQNNKYDVVVDEKIVDEILKYEPYMTRLNKYVKYGRKWDSNEERAIPKSNESSRLHIGLFNLSNYKRMIDILDNEEPSKDKKDKLYKIDILCGQYYSIMQQKYDISKKDKKLLNGKKTKYGYFGKAAKFGTLCGGAKQINTIFDYEELVCYGIIENAELFYKKDNKFVSREIEYHKTVNNIN